MSAAPISSSRSDHGSITTRELQALGLTPGTVIDFSASTNPLGPSPSVWEAIQRVDLSRYPEDGSPALRSLLAQRCHLPESYILVTAGSNEAFWLLAFTSLMPLYPHARVVIATPTFSEYNRVSTLTRAAIMTCEASAARSYRCDLATLQDAIEAHRPHLTFLCDPNNPTGDLAAPGVLRSTTLGMLARAAAPGLLVVDESFALFADVPEEAEYIRAHENLVLVRSLTKTHGLAGLRIGFVIADPAVITTLQGAQMPWSVSSVAEAAALAALADKDHWQRTYTTVKEGRAMLTIGLSKLGLPFLPSTVNYLLVRTGNARRTRARLLRYGCAVRDATSFGLPDYIRVGIRTLPECACLLGALAQLQKEFMQ